MRGAIRSLTVFLIALLAVCFISVPGFTGEHPWDSDGNKNGSTGTGSGSSEDPSKGSTAIALSAQCPIDNGNDLLMSGRSMMSLVFRVSYFFVERVSFGPYEAGTKMQRATRSSSR
jgi:hypothetical protein